MRGVAKLDAFAVSGALVSRCGSPAVGFPTQRRGPSDTVEAFLVADEAQS